MDVLEVTLPVVINILLIVLLTVGIILIIKCIYLVDKAKKVMDDVERKVNSFNSLFMIIDIFNEKIASLSDKIAELFDRLFSKLLRKKDEDEIIIDYEDVKVKKGRKKNG